jgi:hypothetical protein
MVILKFLKKMSVELRGETTMKPIPYSRQLDLQIGRAQTGFRTGALPSAAAAAPGLHGSIRSLTT